MSPTTALEAKEIWIATLIVHVHTQYHSEQWKGEKRERWVCGWRWVGFVIVGYNCYDYAVVYALWLFLSVLLLCFRWFVFMSLLFMELLSTVFAMYCFSSFDSIRGVLLIDVSSFWVYWIKSSALSVHAHVISNLGVPNGPLRNPTTNCNSIPLTITYHNPLLIFRESRIRVWR